MITVGIDIGMENTRVLLLNNGKTLAKGCVRSGAVGRAEKAEKLLERLLNEAGIAAEAVAATVVTGIGTYDVKNRTTTVTEPIAAAVAARFLFPDARSVIDCGADQTRLVILGEGNDIEEIVLNQKCSAGIGTFFRILADDLDMELSGIASLEIDGCESVGLNTGCCVFAELGALERLFSGDSRESIAHDGVKMAAVRINSILNEKIRPAPEGCVLVGGVANNRALVRALELRSGIGFQIPPDPEYACALGCALIGAESPFSE